MIVVDVPVATQLTRTMDRDDNTREQVQAIIDAQASREQRLRNADFVITNDRNLPSLYEQIDALHNDLMQQCQNHQE